MTSFPLRSILQRRLSIGGALLALGAASLLAVVPGCVESRSDVPPRAVTPRGPLGADELAHIERLLLSDPRLVCKRRTTTTG